MTQGDSPPAVHLATGGAVDADTVGQVILRPAEVKEFLINQRADKELKAPPALGGSAIVARPTRPQIFAVN